MSSAASSVPAWFDEILARLHGHTPPELAAFVPPPGHQRRSAVLILLGPSADAAPPGVDVLLTERSPQLRSHAGQVAFPGGRIDDTDATAPDAALREAQEETGLDPAGVDIVGCLPDLFLPVSDYAVTPVLGWWRAPSPVAVLDTREVAAVQRVPVAELVDPANRFLVVHPSGFVGPGFRAGGLFVWGFTAGLLDRVLTASGWALAWDRSVTVELNDQGRPRPTGEPT